MGRTGPRHPAIQGKRNCRKEPQKEVVKPPRGGRPHSRRKMANVAPTFAGEIRVPVVVAISLVVERWQGRTVVQQQQAQKIEEQQLFLLDARRRNAQGVHVADGNYLQIHLSEIGHQRFEDAKSLAEIPLLRPSQNRTGVCPDRSGCHGCAPSQWRL